METVCVTGASGYLGSWLVMRLLQRGYNVRGTVRSLEDKSKIEHLLSLPESKERLELVKADLLDEYSLLVAVKGCDRVFAVAAPFLDPPHDEGSMIEANVAATINLLRACSKSQCVKRVLMTSTYYAAVQVPHTQGQIPFEIDEAWWSSEEYCTKNKKFFWGYVVAKTVAEKAAFEYAKENKLDFISILPSYVGGPSLAPRIPGSLGLYLATMTEGATWMKSLLGYMSYVHVDDTTQAHILLMEDPHASGRYLCSAVDATLTHVLDEVASLLKSYNMPPSRMTSTLDKDSSEVYYKINTRKLKDMGFCYKYDTIHKIFEDTMLFAIDRGYLKKV